MSRFDKGNDSEQPRTGRRSVFGRDEQLPLLKDADLFSKQEQERERARRVCIYADMVRKTGEVKYRLLASWLYQPSEEDIDAMQEAIRTKNKEFNRPKAVA